MNELLKIVDKLGVNQVYGLEREDGMLISVTRYLENIPRMISEEFCGIEVKITKVVYNKQPMNWTIYADLIEDGDTNEYEFLLSQVAFYN